MDERPSHAWDSAAPPATSDAPRRVLVTGATGYVGGRLLHRLATRTDHRLRCLTRRPEALAGRVGPRTELVAGDVLDPGSLHLALEGVDTAYYLIHSMQAPAEFEELDRRGATNFATAAARAGLRRLIYLGGLGDGDRDRLSPHLASRHEVGEILRTSRVPTIEFRASIVVGAGSASYEIVRACVEAVPVMVTPRHVMTAAQPIAIGDLLEYLVTALDWPGAESAIFEIGGADRVSYAEIMREYARQRQLRRYLLSSPLLTLRSARLLLGMVAPLHRGVAGTLVDSLRNETVVKQNDARAAFPIAPMGLRQSIARALGEEDQEFARTRWSTSSLAHRRRSFAGVAVNRRIVSTRVLAVAGGRGDPFQPIQRIGGDTGWYAGDWFWALRGWLDRLRGGAGLRRGRRDPVDLRPGDAVDFWRVERFQRDQLLLLAAEMKMPGRLWLQFELDCDGPAGARIRQTTVFDPAGCVGRAYWCLFWPVHQLVFISMLRAIVRATRS